MYMYPVMSKVIEIVISLDMCRRSHNNKIKNITHFCVGLSAHDQWKMLGIGDNLSAVLV